MKPHENTLADIILDAAFELHREIGPGLLESAYERALEFDLRERGLKVVRQHPVRLSYKGLEIEDAYRIDLLVEGSVVVEIKSVRTLEAVFLKQVMTYLKLADVRLGLLINFNEVMLRNGVRRVVNGLKD